MYFLSKTTLILLGIIVTIGCESNTENTENFLGESHSNASLFANPEHYNYGSILESSSTVSSEKIQISNIADRTIIMKSILIPDNQINLLDSSTCQENLTIESKDSCSITLSITPNKIGEQSFDIGIEFWDKEKTQHWSNSFKISWNSIQDEKNEFLKYKVSEFIAEFNVNRQGSISWKQGSLDIKGYRIVFAEGNQIPKSCTGGKFIEKNNTKEYKEIIDGFKKFDTEYTIRLCAVKNNGDEVALQYSTLRRDLPKYIADFNAQFIDSSNVKLTWLPTSGSDIKNYKISYNPGVSPPVDCSSSKNTLSTSGLTTTISGLSESLYVFRLCPVLPDGSLDKGEVARARGGAPKVILKSKTGLHSASENFTINISFDQVVSKLEKKSISITGGDILSLANDGDKFTLKIKANSSDIKISVKKGAVKNSRGIPNDISEISLSYDIVAPTGEIINLSSSPTGEATSEFILSFSEKVYNVTPALTITGATLSSLKALDKSYNLKVNHVTEGTITISIDNSKVTDLAGNSLTAPLSYDYTYDKTPPTAVSIAIESGSTYANSQRVTITLLASGSPSQMLLNESQDCSGSGTWEDYSTSYMKNLTAASGSTNVSVKFRDATGNESECIYDSIIIDTQKPSSVSNLVLTMESLTQIAYSFSGSTDDLSGISEYQLAIGSIPGATDVLSYTSLGSSTSGTYNPSTPLSLGSRYYINVIAVDTASNQSDATEVKTVSGFGQEAYIKASNSGENDYFSYSIDISNNTMVAGAIGEANDQSTITNSATISSNDNYSYAGAAYVFARSAHSWSQEAYLKAPNAQSSDQFGRSVAISGDIIAVGAQNEDSSQTTIVNGSTITNDNNDASSSGAVYVFTKSANDWTHEAYLKASNAEGSDSFGSSIDISNETIIVGAYNEDSSQSTITHGSSIPLSNGSTYSGAAYIFTRSATTWTQEAYLKASNRQSSDTFGRAVAISEDTVVVGADQEDSNHSTITNGSTISNDNSSASSSGAAYVFKRSATTWTQEAYLKATNPGPSDKFGTTVAISGDTIVIGTHDEDSDHTTITNGSTIANNNNDAGSSGAAYVFKRSAATWSQEAYLKASNAEGGDRFGNSVSISGDTIVVGAYDEDSGQSTVTNGTATAASDNDTLYSGAAYVFQRSANSWSQTAYMKALNRSYAGGFGRGVAISGDTIAVGSYMEDSDQSTISNSASASWNTNSLNSGAVYIFSKTYK